MPADYSKAGEAGAFGFRLVAVRNHESQPIYLVPIQAHGNEIKLQGGKSVCVRLRLKFYFTKTSTGTSIIFLSG